MVPDRGRNYEVIKMYNRLLEENFFDSAFENIQNLSNGILALDFAIPEQIFLALNVLTRFVGYILPLRLYTPIITLILGYWVLMILSYSTRFVFNLVKKIVPFFK